MGRVWGMRRVVVGWGGWGGEEGGVVGDGEGGGMGRVEGL